MNRDNYIIFIVTFQILFYSKVIGYWN